MTAIWSRLTPALAPASAGGGGVAATGAGATGGAATGAGALAGGGAATGSFGLHPVMAKTSEIDRQKAAFNCLVMAGSRAKEDRPGGAGERLHKSKAIIHAS
ncbi:hypothetical protein F2P46_31020 [Massilia sp. CCM 8734]|nr:hypothetical protein [Massilia sp. CCM 8734]